MTSSIQRMPQRRNNIKPPPPVMTWPKALPVLTIAFIFYALRLVCEQFWFFGPALATLYCTTAISDKIGALGGAVAAGCTAVAGAAGYFGTPVFIALGTIMAMAVGLFGWMTIGLILIMTNNRIFKENANHALWFVLGLAISEVPIVGAIPGVLGITIKMYHTQIKKDKENMKKYEKEQATEQLQERRHQALEQIQFQQARAEEIPEEMREAA